MKRRIEIDGVLYEEVESPHSRRSLREASASPFRSSDYRSFGVGYPHEEVYLPDGSEPLVYWKGGFWRPGREGEVAAVALLGANPYDGEWEPDAYIDLRWPTPDREVHVATRDFMELDDARETFDRILRDIDDMTPDEIVRKYRLNER